MFRRLRIKLIWSALGITTAIMVPVFLAIYFITTNLTEQRFSELDNKVGLRSEETNDVAKDTIRHEKQAAAKDLLITLILAGVEIEIIVAIVTYFTANQTIKPARDAYESQKLFIANASHEIKTPLAAISANLEAADIHDNKWISNIEKEVNKLSSLNNELLILARNDLVDEGTLDEVDLRALVNDYVKSLEPRLPKIQFTTKMTTHGKVLIVASDFTQLLGILLDNAIKYSDKRIRLVLTNNELTVSNDGTTISKDDLPHIFERFYQVDKSSEGAGLGLAIAKSIAVRNNWDLTADSRNKTTKFTLKF
ncbi:HAMP domain-containing histidine kinase [Candidatus Saccharibacteria bacterium]|nr:HAMP domain-containing histidine kinase [Candidatus Saccharibacteria bacterium]